MSKEDWLRLSKPDIPGSHLAGSRTSLVVASFLVGTAIILVVGPWQFASPIPASVPVPSWAIDPTPVRKPSLKPQIEIAGFTYRCSDCHKLFSSPPETTRSLTQHTNIVLQHGINDRCFNCHHLTNRDAYVDDWGKEIPADKPQLLCAKCHGPVYRDWLHGAHGRTNGYWDKAMGPQVRLKCIECHDPHVPPFAPLKPAPGPHTLRMGDQHFASEHEGVPNPLRVYRTGVTRHDGESAASRPTH